MSGGEGRAAGWPPPRANPLLIGQEAAESILLRSWRSGRLPHAWILSGPKGIGKATLAYRFARFVLSGSRSPQASLSAVPETGLAMEPAAPLFRQVASGGHPDLLAVERSVDEQRGRVRDEIVVEDVRRIGAFLRLTAGAGGWRVVIVDSADELNRSAANALLKILEEPPHQALLLLVAHAPGRLLATIRSRCRMLALEALAPETAGRLLEHYCPDLDANDRRVLLQLAEGSIGRALDLAAADGVAVYREMLEVVGSLPRLDVAALHVLGDRLARAESADRFRTLADLLSWWLARLVRAGAARRLPGEVMAGEGDAMRRLLERGGLDQWVALWEKITLLFARADGLALDRKQVVLTAFLDFAATARG